ncbi:cytochrome P450 [Laetiporus sulphureus 93-53]|uniref:Cytochrome P450 n=1 Tax=Laetiporus sulphureus 93-53 TaxID=1314785 RepID=A0A165HPC7_9APHY|nr:cytochrome P450 [Laetiporus sulphureus 93-53]KZT12005.1 cytochrome P450 [Laetiporus sulphureus 93-53]
MAFNLISVTALLCILLYLLYRLRIRTRSSVHELPVPPGPKPLPWIGNLHQIPFVDQSKVYTQWGSTYGDILYMHTLGREFIILNSASAALELFDKRGHLYSDRPHLTMAGDLVGRGKSVLFNQYGDRLRRYRKHLRNALNSRTAMDYWSFQEAESIIFLEALLRTPDDFIAHIRRNAGAVTLKLAYGYTLTEGEDCYVTLAEKLAYITTEASEPGKWLVDSFPWLRHIPSWFPGAHFKRWAHEAHLQSEEFTNAPYDMVKRNMSQGTAVPSFTSRALESVQEETGEPPSVEEEDIIKWAAASIYAGGTDTTVALITAFFLIVTCYPDIQKKAQAEIDKVIGRARLPVMTDESNLPYIGCLIKELHRFNPIVPLIPHSLHEDDEYCGFRIPKDSWVMANSWSIMHDTTMYPEDERFNPERFMGNVQTDPQEFSFGFGRRRCPGINFAKSSIFLSIAQTLAVFDILKPLDENGREYTPPLAFTSGHVSCAPEAIQLQDLPAFS